MTFRARGRTFRWSIIVLKFEAKRLPASAFPFATLTTTMSAILDSLREAFEGKIVSLKTASQAPAAV